MAVYLVIYIYIYIYAGDKTTTVRPRGDILGGLCPHGIVVVRAVCADRVVRAPSFLVAEPPALVVLLPYLRARSGGDRSANAR